MMEKSELSEGTFTPKPNKKTVKAFIKTEDFDRVYTIKGRHDELVNDSDPVLHSYKGSNGLMYKPEERFEAAARKVKSGVVVNSFIKKNSRGELFDPKNTSHLNTSLSKINGLPVFRMQKVSEAQFEHYLQYLRTGNKLYLSQAQKVY